MLRFHTPSIKGLNFTSLSFHGSVALEKHGQRGISHLCEHLLCDSFKPLEDFLTKSCINYNAVTSENFVAFFFGGLDEYVTEAIDKVLHGPCPFFRYIPDAESFERERNVVIQEYESYFSDAQNILAQNVLRKHYGFYGAIGHDTDLRALKLEDVQQFIDTYFRRPSDLLRIGNTPSDYAEHPAGYKNAFSNIVQTFSTLTQSASIDNIEQRFSPDVDFVPQSFSQSSRETIIGDWLHLKFAEPWEVAFIAELWTEGLLSPLMSEIREKRGYAYSAGTWLPLDAQPMLMHHITTAPENVENVRALLKDMYENWDSFITPERFNLIKSKAITQHRLVNLNNTTRQWAFRSQMPTSIVPSIDMLKELTYEDICMIHAKNFNGAQWNIAQTGKELVV